MAMRKTRTWRATLCGRARIESLEVAPTVTFICVRGRFRSAGTFKTPVFKIEIPPSGPVAQPDRAAFSKTKGRSFEPCRDRHENSFVYSDAYRAAKSAAKLT